MVDLGRALGATRRPYADNRPWTTGQVVADNPATGRVEVLVDGTRTVLPRQDGSYASGDTVLIVRDPDASGSGQVVLGTIGHTPSAPRPSTGTVTAVGSSSITVSAGSPARSLTCQAVTSAVVAVGDTALLVYDDAGAPWVVGKVGVIPTIPATPTGLALSRTDSIVDISWTNVAGATRYEIRWSYDGGATWATIEAGNPATRAIAPGSTITLGVRASNSAGSSAWSSSVSLTYPAPTPSTEQVTAVIRPTWSGTYRHSRAAWDRWNTDRYGGRATLYQGSGYGSGTLTGLATYGTQVRDLGAISIDRMTVALRDVGVPAAMTVQGSPNGGPPGGAPSASGDTATGGPNTDIELPASIREGFRGGSFQGLCTVGGTYGATAGTSAADGMALVVTYTRAR